MSTLRIEVHAERNMFGKRTNRFIATLGPWTAVGTTKDEAVLILTEQLNSAERYSLTRRYLHAPDKTVFTLYHTYGGWHYDMAHPDGSVSGCTLGKDFQTEKQAFESMHNHWKQYSENACSAPVR